jgi:hypothetical protein
MLNYPMTKYTNDLMPDAILCYPMRFLLSLRRELVPASSERMTALLDSVLDSVLSVHVSAASIQIHATRRPFSPNYHQYMKGTDPHTQLAVLVEAALS